MTINLKKAVFFILISSFSFSVMQLCVKLSGTTIPLMQQMFFRNLITLFLATFIILRENGSFFGKRENRKYLFLDLAVPRDVDIRLAEDFENIDIFNLDDIWEVYNQNSMNRDKLLEDYSYLIDEQMEKLIKTLNYYRKEYK